METSSDSSDSDHSATTIDFRNHQLNADTIDHNLLTFINRDKKSGGHLEIETMLLQENRLITFPDQLRQFSQLKVLDISNNGLTVLPDIFEYCRCLSTLVARNNRLTNDSLPKVYNNTDCLRELNLSGNELTTVPEQLFEFSSLRYLYLGGNRIRQISRNIWKMKNLHILSLGGNQLTEVPSTVGQLKMLSALILCDNQIEVIPASIAYLNNLKSLLLHKNRIKTLPPEIVTLRNLSELSLRDNPLVVRFVSDMTLNPGSLLELSARAIKIANIDVKPGDIPISLMEYMDSAHRCVNAACKGVYFDNRVEHIKFVDFCGKYRIPLLQYLCSTKCRNERRDRREPSAGGSYMMRKVLLG